MLEMLFEFMESSDEDEENIVNLYENNNRRINNILLGELLTSSDDNEDLYGIERRLRPKIHNYVENVVYDYTDAEVIISNIGCVFF